MIRKSSYFLLGFISLMLGIIGAFLPLLPTTVFILIAAWAFARSSDRLHNALLDHHKTGPMIRNWQANQCIPRPAKIAAAVSMFISWLIVFWFSETWVALLVALALLLVLAFIVSRPSEPVRGPES